MKVVTDVPQHLFTLPAYEPQEKKKRENNNIPDVESLTPEQREVYDTILAYLKGELDPTIMMLAIKGFAGTGKTYVITQVLKWFVLMMQDPIAITAPTNKAVKVLRSTSNFEHSLITYGTIHKLFGLKEKIDEITGKQTFEQEFGTMCDIQEKNALVIDETSMLNDELFHLVKSENDREKEVANNSVKSVGTNVDDFFSAMSKQTKTEALKVIFLGDPIQIPPVGKDDCIPFNENNADIYGIKTLTLEQIIRQKEGNPILDLATIIRQNYKESYLPYKKETVCNDIGGVLFINSDDKEVLYRICETYFASEQFNADSDFMKVIAWTNRTVDFMNDKIRSYIYKEELQKLKDEAVDTELANAPEEIRHAVDTETISKSVKLPRILIGEKLIANTPIVQEMGFKQIVQFQTNDEFEVLSAAIKTRNVFDNYEVSVYETKVSYTNYATDKKEIKIIDVLHENSINTFNQILETLKKKAITADKQLRGQAWKFFYSMKNKFADVKYNYAITAHKSQGSTYDNAIVIAVDIFKNKKVEERNRILYVATTRAKNNLFMVE